MLCVPFRASQANIAMQHGTARVLVIDVARASVNRDLRGLPRVEQVRARCRVARIRADSKLDGALILQVRGFPHDGAIFSNEGASSNPWAVDGPTRRRLHYAIGRSLRQAAKALVAALNRPARAPARA